MPKKSSYSSSKLEHMVLYMSILFIVEVVIYTTSKSFSESHPHLDVISISILIHISIMFLSIVACAIGTAIAEWWRGLSSDLSTYNADEYATNKPIKRPLTTPIKNRLRRSFTLATLLPGERKCPPRAEFFARIKGKPIEIIGTYEEDFLNQYELKYWKEQKEKNTKQEEDIINKAIEHSTEIT